MFVLIAGLILYLLVTVQPAVGASSAALLVTVPVGMLVVALQVLTGPWRGWMACAGAGVGAAVVAYLALWVVAGPSGFPSSTFGSRDAPIADVYTRPGAVVVEVGVDTCNQDPEVSALETGDEVRLSSNEKVPRGAANDCKDSDQVTLSEPIGNRLVVDEASGEAVEVSLVE